MEEQQLSSERLTLISSLPALIYRTHWFGLWTQLDNIAATVFYTGHTEAKQDPTRPAEPTLPTWSDHMIQTGNTFTLKDVAGEVPELWKWNSALNMTLSVAFHILIKKRGPAHQHWVTLVTLYDGITEVLSLLDLCTPQTCTVITCCTLVIQFYCVLLRQHRIPVWALISKVEKVSSASHSTSEYSDSE